MKIGSIDYSVSLVYDECFYFLLIQKFVSNFSMDKAAVPFCSVSLWPVLHLLQT